MDGPVPIYSPNSVISHGGKPQFLVNQHSAAVKACDKSM